MKLHLFPLSLVVFLFLATPVYAGGLNVPENIRLNQIECGVPGKGNAYAYFSWDTAQGATSYRFYSKIADGRDAYRAYDETTEANYKMSFNPQFDFYVAVSSVNTFTGNPPSVSESEKSKDFFLSARKLLTLCNKEQAETTPTTAVDDSPPTPTINYIQKEHSQDIQVSDAKVKELEQKLSTLENKLVETQKRQSALERLVNNLLGLLRRLFGQ